MWETPFISQEQSGKAAWLAQKPFFHAYPRPNAVHVAIRVSE